MLYLALGETDDWAHDERYDRVLQTLERTDAWFKELWTWLQTDAQYRDNTAILITVDHGRGRTPKDWGNHGDDVDGAQETWLAAIGPDWPRRGEWTDAPGRVHEPDCRHRRQGARRQSARTTSRAPARRLTTSGASRVGAFVAEGGLATLGGGWLTSAAVAGSPPMTAWLVHAFTATARCWPTSRSRPASPATRARRSCGWSPRPRSTRSTASLARLARVEGAHAACSTARGSTTSSTT